MLKTLVYVLMLMMMALWVAAVLGASPKYAIIICAVLACACGLGAEISERIDARKRNRSLTVDQIINNTLRKHDNA